MQGSNNKPTEQQSLKQDNRKRSADQSLKSKEQIVREVVPTTNQSQSTADTAGTFDRIFTVLMTADRSIPKSTSSKLTKMYWRYDLGVKLSKKLKN